MYPQHLLDDLSDPQFVSRASALATDCEVEVAADPKRSVKEVRQNKALGMDLSFLLSIRG
jgi:hypothetical protein